MDLEGLAPLSAIITLLGFFAMLFGFYTLSAIIFIDGIFLLWIGFRITVSAFHTYPIDT